VKPILSMIPGTDDAETEDLSNSLLAAEIRDLSSDEAITRWFSDDDERGGFSGSMFETDVLKDHVGFGNYRTFLGIRSQDGNVCCITIW